jgi:hypothetical protein
MVSRAYHGVAGVDPSLKSAQLLQALESSSTWLVMARGSIALAAGLALIASFVWASRARRVSRAQLAGAASLCLVGALAFAVTRGRAADRHPLPILASGVVEVGPFDETPRLANCPRQQESLPVLRFSPDAVTLDGVPSEPDRFRDGLMVRRANHALLHDGRPAPAALALVIAPGATPLTRILPYLQTGPDGLWMMGSISPHPHPSRTLGLIPRFELCGRLLRLSESAPPISNYSTWAALAAAVDRAPGAFAAAPW